MVLQQNHNNKLKTKKNSNSNTPVVSNKDKNKNITNIRVSDLISDNFHSFWGNSKPYAILKGGRSSLKSSAASLKIVMKFIEDDKANVVCFRKVAKYLSTSVYEQIKWAIMKLGLYEEFTFMKSPLKIVHKRTKTAFYFYGVDEPQKIKSAKIAEGYVRALWFEETAEFDSVEEIDIVTDTFIREDLPDGIQVEITFTYNPPRNPYIWINEWVEEMKTNEDYYIHHSTYEDDTKGFLSEQFLRKVKRMKEIARDYHDWMYGGLVIGLGDIIYNMDFFHVVGMIPSDDRILFADIALDTGYSVSATTFLYLGYTLKGRVILLDTYYYSPEGRVVKKAPSDFSKELWEFSQRNNQQYKLNIDTWTIDSAEAGLRNQFYKDYGISLTPAKKKKKYRMIENVEDLLVQDRMCILDTERNSIFIKEHRMYQWEAKSLKTDDPKVVKQNDHTCDAFQYYVNNNLARLVLKI